MIIKSTKKKENKKVIFNLLLSYFVLTILLSVLFLVLFFNTGIWQNNKDKFIQRIHLNGIYNYKYIPNILKLIFTNPFSKLETLYVDINQKNIIILEKNRKDKLKNKKAKFTSAKANIKANNKYLRADDDEGGCNPLFF